MTQTGLRTTKSGMLLLGGLILLWAALHFNFLASSLTATWSYDYSQIPACPMPLNNDKASDCIDHFEILDITRQDRPRTIVSVNSSNSPTGKIDGMTAKFKYGPPFGEITFSVVAVKRQKDRTLVSSNPFAARTTVTIHPGVKASILF